MYLYFLELYINFYPFLLIDKNIVYRTSFPPILVHLVQKVLIRVSLLSFIRETYHIKGYFVFKLGKIMLKIHWLVQNSNINKHILKHPSANIRLSKKKRLLSLSFSKRDIVWWYNDFFLDQNAGITTSSFLQFLKYWELLLLCMMRSTRSFVEIVQIKN